MIGLLKVSLNERARFKAKFWKTNMLGSGAVFLCLCTMLPSTGESQYAKSHAPECLWFNIKPHLLPHSSLLNRVQFALLLWLYDHTRSHANLLQDQGQENSVTGHQPLGPT